MSPVAATPGGDSIGSLLDEAAGLRGDSPRLDAELLLAHCLGCSRTSLRAWPERAVTPANAARYRELLARRAAGEPVAYLLGQREFWSLSLTVRPGCLIPRPDTERLVELALELGPSGSARVLDLGTGSGAIALALASERSHWTLLAVDIDPGNVALTRDNAARLGLDNVQGLVSDWYAALQPGSLFDLIVANPPYLADDDPHLGRGDLRFEPRRALVAAAQGLADLAHLTTVAPAHLRPGGWLLLEHGFEQAAAVRRQLEAAGFEAVTSWRDLGGHERVSGGRAPRAAAAAGEGG